MFCFPTGIFTAAFDCQIEWLIVKGIADYADGSQLASESWSSCASMMAASLVAHILNEPRIFHSWPHYQGNHALIKCCHISYDLLNHCWVPFIAQSQSRGKRTILLYTPDHTGVLGGEVFGRHVEFQRTGDLCWRSHPGWRVEGCDAVCGWTALKLTKLDTKTLKQSFAIFENTVKM